MPRVSVPTTARLPSSLRVPASNSAALKILSRLSRSSLLSVALDWLDDNNLPLTQPYLREDEDEDDDDADADDFYPPARSPHALRELYISLQARKGSRREVLDRITEGDWRHGLTLYQLAMADLQYLHDHPTSQKWSAYRIQPLQPPQDPDNPSPPKPDPSSLTIPRFHPSTFLRTLQTQILPDIKAHYNFDAHRSLPLLILRIFVLDSPYNTALAAGGGGGGGGNLTNFDLARTVYIAFPHASPHLFISKPTTTTTSSASSGGGEAKSLRNLLVEGIPKALSRPLRRERFALQGTGLVTRNLAEMVERRGAGRTNAAGGGWGWYADEKGVRARETPLDLVLPSPPLSVDEEAGGEGGGGGKRAAAAAAGVVVSEEERRAERAAKRARLVARARFGETVRVGDGKGVERVDVVIEDAFPAVGDQENRVDDEEDGVARVGRGGRRSQIDDVLGRDAQEEEEGEDDELGQGWRPYVRLTFHGPHVFGGVRQLVECGIIDGERMPGWMTGEEGVTIGAVRNGRIRGHKGSGL